MASFNIISGTLKSQSTMVVGNQFSVDTKDGGLRTYVFREAVKKLKVISKTEKKIVFEITLQDEEQFTAESKPKDFEKIKEMYSARSGRGEKFILSEITAQQKKHRMFWVLLFLGFFSWFIYMLVTSYEGTSGSTPKIVSVKDKEAEAIVYCKKLMKVQLKAPSTADFPWLPDNSYIEGNQITIRSHVDAQNGFGAMIRTNYVCKLQYENESLELVSFDTY